MRALPLSWEGVLLSSGEEDWYSLGTPLVMSGVAGDMRPSSEPLLPCFACARMRMLQARLKFQKEAIVQFAR